MSNLGDTQHWDTLILINKKILFFISDSGYGHSRRSSYILDLLQKNSYEVIVYANKEKLSYIFKKSHNKNVLFKIVDFKYDGNSNTKIEFNKKRSFFESVISKHKPNAVISDNFIEVIGLHRFIFILSSFIWQKERIGSVANEYNFLKYIDRLIKNNKTYFLTTSYFKPKYYNSIKNVVDVGLFGKTQNKKNSIERKILISCGGACINFEPFYKIYNLLSNTIIYKDSIIIEKSLKEKFKISNVEEFDYSPSSYQMIDVVICRPGVGTLSDALLAGIMPICLVGEENSEIINNSKILSDAGLAISYNTKENVTNDVLKMINDSRNMYKKIKIKDQAEKRVLEIIGELI